MAAIFRQICVSVVRILNDVERVELLSCSSEIQFC